MLQTTATSDGRCSMQSSDNQPSPSNTCRRAGMWRGVALGLVVSYLYCTRTDIPTHLENDILSCQHVRDIISIATPRRGDATLLVRTSTWYMY